ncbi:MAG: ABC transporter ATP-binding protein [Clostridia bacterium]|nr:ABC transporter ATP-binding protein [Clostridia bacterium]
MLELLKKDPKTKRQRQKVSSVVKNNLYMIGKVARYTPDYFFLMILEGVIWGLINSASSVFSFRLLNAIDDGTDFAYAASLIGLMALFYLLAYAFSRWYWTIHNQLIRYRLHIRMHEELFRKARTLELACFDDPEFYNDFVWAMNESDSRAVAVMEDTGKLINRIVASGTLMTLMFSVDPIIAVILLVVSGVSIVANLIGNRVGFYHSRANNPLHRKKNYINRTFRLADYAKEIRISHADDLLFDEYDDTMQKLLKTDRSYGYKYFFTYGFAWDFLRVIAQFGMIAYMITLLEGGTLLIGGFAAAVGVEQQILWLLDDLVGRVTKYAQHSLYIERHREFMRYEPRIKGEITEVPPFESLELKNVSFTYAFTNPKYQFHEAQEIEKRAKAHKEYEALKNVSLTIRAGEKIAIVGYNGAGKTTLIKLLMRFYDPTEGQILYNGVDIRSYDPDAYRKQIGTVFQDFKIFATSLAENVMNGEYDEARDRERVTDALRSADFTEKLGALPEGLGTHLTREFNDKGTNLSGGEAQKVAIARVFANEYPIVIMDEPSAALDPLSEYQLNQSILHRTDDKTVIFISHRLSTTRIADEIYMFDSGHLIEHGSHDALLSAGGKYAEMFRVQSEKYKVEE